MSTFKLVVIAIFSVSILFGVALFALSKGSSSGTASNLVVWGTVSRDIFDTAYRASSLAGNKLIKIQYIQKEQNTFDSEFVNSLADGSGPDIVLVRDDFIYKQRNRFFTIPYANYSERSFKDAFIEEGELFLASDGVVALPFMVDPLVMYWNRTTFSNNQIPQTPKYWDEIYPLIAKTTKRDSSANILQSTIAFGEWRNVVNAKEIISMLLLQAGTPIVSRTVNGVDSVLDSRFDLPVAPGQSALSFYTQFSNPTSPTYSWNRSLPTSLNMFLSGNLAMYIGFASEIASIQNKNPNLNFDVAPVPQIRDSAKKVVFGHMYALALVKQSKQISGAFTAVSGLTESSAIKALEPVTSLPPVRRDLLSQVPTDAFTSVFYNSALISHSWIDPDSMASANTFRDMIESVTSGKKRVSDAVYDASQELSSQLK